MVSGQGHLTEPDVVPVPGLVEHSEQNPRSTTAVDVGFTPEWHDPFITVEGLAAYGADFFSN